MRGAAGAHGRGAVVVTPGERPDFDTCTVERLVLLGGGEAAPLPEVEGGWSWQPASVASDDPDAPLQELQRRMREAEGRLAEDLCARGHLTIVDGPLNFVRSRDLPVVGYVKTHYRPLLPPDLHERVPELQAGERTSLIAARSDVYTSYLRLTEGSRAAGPWSGIVRLEVPASPGLKAAVETIDSVAASLPRFAGIPHADPRAPQNLQPIGALETHLRHLLGDVGLATRAVRSAVDQLHLPAPDPPGDVPTMTDPVAGSAGAPQPVGLVDGSSESSTSRFWVVLKEHAMIQLDDLLVCHQKLPDGTEVAHYGIVVEAGRSIEGATFSSDTARIARDLTMPGITSRRVEVQVLRTVPELWLAPDPGTAVYRAAGAERDRALFIDEMAQPLAVGVDQRGEPVHLDFSFLSGERGGHVNISGISGVATKTTYAMFLLYRRFADERGVEGVGVLSA